MSLDNKTRYAILGVLSLSPGSGYDIKKFCDQGISYFWNENFGHIYPVLQQLEKDGEISKATPDNAVKRGKNIYSITPKGTDRLIDWLVHPMDESPARIELLLKLTFARNVSPEAVIHEITRIKDKHIQRLSQFEEKEKEFNSVEQTRMDPGYPYWLATLHYGIYDAMFRIRWCEETIESIRNHTDFLAEQKLPVTVRNMEERI